MTIIVFMIAGQVIEFILILVLFARKCNHKMVDVEPYDMERGGVSKCEICDRVKVYAPLPK